MTTSADLQAYAATDFGLSFSNVELSGAIVTTDMCYKVEGDVVNVSSWTYVESGVWSADTDYDNCSVDTLSTTKSVMTKAEARCHYKHNLQLGFRA